MQLTSKKKKAKYLVIHAQCIIYKFPVLSSSDCLMEEPIFLTCYSDVGQMISLTFSVDLELSSSINGKYSFLRSRFLVQIRRK